MSIFIDTPRLVLREMVEEDADAFSSYNQSAEFSRYRNLSPSPERMREKVLRSIARTNKSNRDDYILTIVHRKNGAVIGDVRLILQMNKEAEPLGIASIGYGLDPAYWGQGLITEAVQAVTTFGHDKLKMHRIEAETHPNNIGSWKVLEKSGYKREGTRQYRYKVHDSWWPETYEYASIRSDLLNHKS